MAKKQPKPKARTTVTFYRNVRGRVRRIGKRFHQELFGSIRTKGILDSKRQRLFYTTYFPTYETAVAYVVTRKLGHDVEPPQFGHWIDANYWKPLCITYDNISYPLEIKDG